MLLVLLAAFAADPAPYRPPAVPTPMPADVLPSPYEGQLVVPAVDVPARVALQSDLRFDLRGLAAAAPVSDAVSRQLAADPRWRVVEWDGARVAYQRVPDGKEWTVPLRGYHVSPTEVWRTALVLRPWAPSSVWATSPLVGRAGASAPLLRLTPFSFVGRPDWRAAAWEWGDPGAVLSVFEAGASVLAGELPHTSAALTSVPEFVGRVAAQAAEITTKGFAASLLPGRKAPSGQPTATIGSPAAGELDVRAWLRTPGPGVTWARVLGGDLEAWEEAAVAAGTREILGHGGDAKQLFYLQGRFPVPAGAAFSGTVEFWHAPDGGGEVTRLAAMPVTVPAR